MKGDTTLEITKATEKDCALILSFIRELAEYEKMLADVVATEEKIRETLFCERPKAEAVLAYYQGKPVGFALYFHNYSTFLAKPGIYLEDLYVKPEYRGKGFGKKLLHYLAKLAKERNCGRLEWWVLDWNESAINFYKSLGAVPMNEWTVYRLAGDALSNLAQEK